MDSLISSNVDVSPNEYVTKYSINRNFRKLIENDLSVNQRMESLSDDIQTYNKSKTYKEGEYVFYKITPDSPILYLLKSVKNGNTHKPLAMYNNVDEKVTINGDYWKIEGIRSDNYIDGNPVQSPMAYATEYVDEKTQSFRLLHEENTADSAHPTGKLGQNESTKLFRNFSNISTERDLLHYPCHVESLTQDKTIKSGFVRKWDNGLLEYDIVYRLGYQYTNGEGKDILCANTLSVSQRNNNYLYFKNRNDYGIFNQGGDGFTTTKNSIQYNLNANLNAYSGKIQFPIEFTDLNYMIFTTNVKNQETEATDQFENYITDYDSRLMVDGSEIVGYDADASYRLPVRIPYKATSIGIGALSDMSETGGYELVVSSDAGDELQTINSYAFQNAQIRRFSFGRNLRYVSEYAFYDCNMLTRLSIHLKNDCSKQVKIEYGALLGTSLSSIDVIYDEPLTFSITETERDKLYSSDKNLEEKLTDKTYLAAIGITTNPTITVHRQNENSIVQIVPGYSFARTDLSKEPMAESKDFANGMMPLRASNIPSDTSLTDIIYYSDDTITGYNEEYVSHLTSNIGIDLGDMPTQVVRIGEGSLSGFDALSSVIIPKRYTDICQNSFYLDSNLTQVSIDMEGSFLYENVFGGCGNLKKITIENVDSGKVVVGEVSITSFAVNSFRNSTIDVLELTDKSSFESVSRYFQNENLGTNFTSLGNSTMIVTGSETNIVRNTSSGITVYETVPGYLTTEGTRVIGCDFSLIQRDSVYRLVIPEGYTEIADNVFSPSKNGYEPSEVYVNSIRIPKTMGTMGNNAFYELSSLSELNMAEGIGIVSLGTDMLYGCVSMQEFTVG